MSEIKSVYNINNTIDTSNIYKIGDLWLKFWEETLNGYKEILDIYKLKNNDNNNRSVYSVYGNTITLINNLLSNSKLNDDILIKEFIKFNTSLINNSALLIDISKEMINIINFYELDTILKRYIMVIIHIINYKHEYRYGLNGDITEEILVLRNYIKGLEFKSSPKLLDTAFYIKHKNFFK